MNNLLLTNDYNPSIALKTNPYKQNSWLLNRDCLQDKIQELSPLLDKLHWTPRHNESLFHASWSYYANGRKARLRDMRRRIEQNTNFVRHIKDNRAATFIHLLTANAPNAPPKSCSVREPIDVSRPEALEVVYTQFLQCFRNDASDQDNQKAEKLSILRNQQRQRKRSSHIATPAEIEALKSAKVELELRVHRNADPYLEQELISSISRIKKKLAQQPFVRLPGFAIGDGPDLDIDIFSKKSNKNKKKRAQHGTKSKTLARKGAIKKPSSSQTRMDDRNLIGTQSSSQTRVDDRSQTRIQKYTHTRKVAKSNSRIQSTRKGVRSKIKRFKSKVKIHKYSADSSIYGYPTRSMQRLEQAEEKKLHQTDNKDPKSELDKSEAKSQKVDGETKLESENEKLQTDEAGNVLERQEEKSKPSKEEALEQEKKKLQIDIERFLKERRAISRAISKSNSAATLKQKRKSKSKIALEEQEIRNMLEQEIRLSADEVDFYKVDDGDFSLLSTESVEQDLIHLYTQSQKVNQKNFELTKDDSAKLIKLLKIELGEKISLPSSKSHALVRIFNLFNKYRKFFIPTYRAGQQNKYRQLAKEVEQRAEEYLEATPLVPKMGVESAGDLSTRLKLFHALGNSLDSLVYSNTPKMQPMIISEIVEEYKRTHEMSSYFEKAFPGIWSDVFNKHQKKFKEQNDGKRRRSKRPIPLVLSQVADECRKTAEMSPYFNSFQYPGIWQEVFEKPTKPADETRNDEPVIVQPKKKFRRYKRRDVRMYVPEKPEQIQKCEICEHLRRPPEMEFMASLLEKQRKRELRGYYNKVKTRECVKAKPEPAKLPVMEATVKLQDSNTRGMLINLYKMLQLCRRIIEQRLEKRRRTQMRCL